MNEDFVPFELAVKLKEKGFKEECLGCYINGDYFYNIHYPVSNHQMWFSHNSYDNIWHRDIIDAPTISQVLKWLRKEKGLHIEILHIFSEETLWNFEVVHIGSYERLWNDSELFDNYEQAALAGIKYVLDNLI